MAPHQGYDDPLGYEKAPSLSFKDAAIGTIYQGTITVPPKLVQSRDFETGNPKTWPDGNPVMSVVIVLEMSDGETRSLWAQKPSSMFAALVSAQKAANAGRMEAGGTLAVRFAGEKPNTKNPKLNAAKQYEAKYIPPAAQADPFADVQPPATPTPAQPPAAKKATW